VGFPHFQVVALYYYMPNTTIENIHDQKMLFRGLLSFALSPLT